MDKQQTVVYQSHWNMILALCSILITLEYFIYYTNVYLFFPMLYLFLLLVIAIYYRFCTPLLEIIGETIYLTPDFSSTTQAVEINQIHFIQAIKEKGIVEFVFHMKNGKEISYKPQLQNKKSINRITAIFAPYIKQVCYKRERCT